MESPRFTIFIELLGESDGGEYLAAGCMSNGATDVEALESAHDAIEAWIEQATDMGHPIPSPTR